MSFFQQLDTSQSAGSAGPGGKPPTETTTSYRYWVLAVVLGALGLVFWRTWVCDDAYITFRVVRNVRLGYGPVFNVGERVQVYTHPLWFLLLSASQFVWPNLHGLSVLFGLLSTILCFAILGYALRPAPQTHGQVANGLSRPALLFLGASTLLLSSRSFVEFQTSGLESCLTHLLLFVLYSHLLVSGVPDRRTSPMLIFALGGLLIVNRLDQAPLIMPLFVMLFIHAVRRDRRMVPWLVLMTLPALIWYTFATIYYGTPLPNTFYAKYCELGWRSGLTYTRDYLSHEPIAALTIVIALFAGPIWFARRAHFASHIWFCVTLGIWLQTAYVIWIGGDFMRGRFFLTSFVSAVFVLLVILRDLLPDRDYQRPVQIILLIAFPCIALVRISEYLPVGLMTGFLSVWGQERPLRIVFLALVAVWGFTAIITGLELFRRKRKDPILVVIVLQLLFLLAMAGYRELDWTVAAGCLALMILTFPLLYRQAQGRKGGFSRIGLGALALALVGHFEFEKPTLTIDATGIVREYEFFSAAWYDNRFHRPEATLQTQIRQLLDYGQAAKRYAERFGPITFQHPVLGFVGWEAGPQVHLIDVYGLSDAYIARCPHPPAWRPGHIRHTVPPEYLEILATLTIQPDVEHRLFSMDASLREDAMAQAAWTWVSPWSNPDDRIRYQKTENIISGPMFKKPRFKILPDFILPPARSPSIP